MTNELWIDEITENDLPVMAGVLSELKAIADDSHSSANQFSEIILKDASLTSQVLKVSNSVYHNPTSTPISTISRAVVQLGTSTIRSICVSAAILEQFLQGSSRERLQQLLARAFHTATQAKNLYELSAGDSSDIESIVISALLMDVGKMAFWSHGGEKADKLDALLLEGELEEAECELQVLGITLDSLTKRLSERWGIAALILSASAKAGARTQSIEALEHAQKLVNALEQGANSEQASIAIEAIAKNYDISNEDAKEIVANGSVEASRVLQDFGAADLCSHIQTASPELEKETGSPPKSDSDVQLNVIRDLLNMAQEKVDLNTLFHAVLEGLHRGVGFERVALLITNRERTDLSAKYVIAPSAEAWKKQLKIKLSNDLDGVFGRVIAERELLQVSKTNGVSFSRMELDATQNEGAAIIAPVLAADKVLGVFYADRQGIPVLDESSVEGFKLFIQQANMCLRLLSRQSN